MIKSLTIYYGDSDYFRQWEKIGKEVLEKTKNINKNEIIEHLKNSITKNLKNLSSERIQKLTNDYCYFNIPQNVDENFYECLRIDFENKRSIVH